MAGHLTDDEARLVRAEELLEIVDAFAGKWKPESGCYCEACIFVLTYLDLRDTPKP